MNKIVTAFEFHGDKCNGQMACLRVCPTHAIRVYEGKAELIDHLCIDCGECINVCPEGAIKPLFDTWENLEKFPFKVAVPSPALFGQFPMDVTPADIVEGLLAIGFDAVYDSSVECEMVNLAIQDYLAESKGPFPLISSSCAVVVRLIQVAYPELLNQVIPIETPREVVARTIKKLYAGVTGLPEEQVGAIYISPCPAKLVSIAQPLEGVESHLDTGISISEIYNPLFAAITRIKKAGTGQPKRDQDPMIRSPVRLGWGIRGGQSLSLKPGRYISVSQLHNVIRVVDDIEKGKITGVEFLECYACPGGCIGGSLTVDDMYIGRSKLMKLIEQVGAEEARKVVAEARTRYVPGDYFLRQPLKPRAHVPQVVPLEEKIEQMKVKDTLLAQLPGLDCCLCGCPSCEVFANDVARGAVASEKCLFLSPDRFAELRRLYGSD